MTTEFFVSDIHGEYEQFIHNISEAKELTNTSVCNKLHVIGDIYDRGPAPSAVISALENRSGFNDFDIQWGNHDIVWMGAALGQRGCVANVVRICARYNNLSLLESTYNISLASLRNFANSVYANDPCALFLPKNASTCTPEECLEIARIQKAIALIQFKVEYVHSTENPSFRLGKRNLLHCINFAAHTLEIEGTPYPMLDMNFPTINPTDPYCLTAEEEAVIESLANAFVHAQRLQHDIRIFLNNGSLYTTVPETLLFHAAVPLNETGNVKETTFLGQTLAGRELFDALDCCVRAAFDKTAPEQQQKQGRDVLWYLWLGEDSPLFTKSKMATFELYFVEDKAIRKEHKNAYYSLLENEQAMQGILSDFGFNPTVSRIISGHVPVKIKDGEDPLKCNGHALVIDGGMSRAYQPTSGIAGMTLVHNEAGWTLIEHMPLESKQGATVRQLPLFDVSCE